MAAKMLALFAFIALCASATTATVLPQYYPTTMAMGAMNPCLQYCMIQQAFAMGSLASPAMMMLQQQLALPFQQYWKPMMTPDMMMLPQCHCDAIWQVVQQQQHMRMMAEMAIQLPFMFDPVAMATSPVFFQQPFVGAAF
uniref:Methionine-rich protein n=1 Tax=Phragmites australis TaxID=29695 RepID=A0A386N7L0_PHRAU|nr:methionine-rich protein [Phragmites australis]